MLLGRLLRLLLLRLAAEGIPCGLLLLGCWLLLLLWSWLLRRLRHVQATKHVVVLSRLLLLLLLLWLVHEAEGVALGRLLLLLLLDRLGLASHVHAAEHVVVLCRLLLLLLLLGHLLIHAEAAEHVLLLHGLLLLLLHWLLLIHEAKAAWLLLLRLGLSGLAWATEQVHDVILSRLSLSDWWLLQRGRLRSCCLGLRLCCSSFTGWLCETFLGLALGTLCLAALLLGIIRIARVRIIIVIIIV